MAASQLVERASECWQELVERVFSNNAPRERFRRYKNLVRMPGRTVRLVWARAGYNFVRSSFMVAVIKTPMR